MLRSLLAPKSIALIGASRHPGKVGHALLLNLKQSGYRGTLLPITLHAKTILGLPCHRSLKACRRKIDLGIIAVAASQVLGAVEDCIQARAKAVIVITAGFKEIGPRGLELENRIKELCRAHQVRLLGPNCIGLVNTHLPLNATFAPSIPPAGAISVISQSGALCVALLDWAAQRHLGFGKVISLGNKADLDEADWMEALAGDSRTKVIVGYLESIANGRRFLEVAEQTAQRKPVVLLKSGTTKAGAKAASSHTGSLAEEDMAYGAAFQQAGVLRADHLEMLFDYGQAFAMQPLPRGNRLCILTNAGGVGILAADAAETAGLQLPPPSEPAMKKLRRLVPANGSAANPIDLLGDVDPARFVSAFKAIQSDDGIDAMLCVVTPQNMTRPLELARRLAAAHDGEKPLLTVFLGGQGVAPAIDHLTRAGLPNYPSPNRAVLALKAMCDYADWRRRPARVTLRYPVNRRRVERVMRWQHRTQIPRVAEVEAKEILHAYGFRTLTGLLAHTAEEAVDAAKKIGFPVVMKIVSPDIIHKSDSGGVKLNLDDADQVRDAHDIIVTRTRRLVPRARVRGVYVEQMGRRGHEVILGMTRDPKFGPMLMFGLGGIFVELMKDVSFHLSPITAEEALQMLRGTRSYELLLGARGEPPVDLTPIIQGLQHISQLATDYPEIQELDINPFVVTELSADAYVADARMTLTWPEEAGKTPVKSATQGGNP